MLILLLGSHLYFTVRLHFIQKKTGTALRLSVQGDGASFGGAFAALSTALAATIGTGNIIGVSTAVALGGPGAVFWCWLTGVLGMATSYAECYLSARYKRTLPDGGCLGGPMVVLHDVLKKKTLGRLFALFTILAAFCVGCSTQAGAITETARSLLGISPYVSGLFVMLLTGYVILRGSKAITRLCSVLVPCMAFFYFLACFYLLFFNHAFLWSAIRLIFRSAFTPSAAASGLIGASVMQAARYGIARGLFTNEAGLGSAPIAFASVKAESPKTQALVSMTAVFWDTVVMCALTGVLIVASLLHVPSLAIGRADGELTSAAFSLLPFCGEALLGIALTCFAFATLIGWSFFGEKAALFLFGNESVKTYRLCYIGMVYLGSVLSFRLIWELTDLINACMAVPNLLCLFLLRKKIQY